MPFLTICSSPQYTRSLANNRFSLFLYANMHKSMCIYLFILYKTFETNNFYSVPQNVELFMNYEIFQSLNRCGQPLWGTFLRTFLWILSSMVITATYIHLLIKGLPAIVPSQTLGSKLRFLVPSSKWSLKYSGGRPILFSTHPVYHYLELTAPISWGPTWGHPASEGENLGKPRGEK